MQNTPKVGEVSWDDDICKLIPEEVALGNLPQWHKIPYDSKYCI